MMLIDAVLLAFICAVPALSHVFAIPFYKLNPMAMCLLAGMLLVRWKGNGYLLAVLLPVVSMLLSGMPVPAVCVCMVAELLSVVGVYDLLERRAGAFVSILAALLSGKVVFYLLKALLVSPAVLIGTNVWLQLAVVVVLGTLFALFRRR
ncbi:MAG: hypothetical protein IKQ53_08565 [Bacteroidales bacterium]|nr:hypothetical protein [Bacteroidales bacterium]